jgi:hypothetical protein
MGAIIHRTVRVHAEVHEIKIGGEQPPITDKEEDHRKMIEARLKELTEGG